jgi:hypothetical protein
MMRVILEMNKMNDNLREVTRQLNEVTCLLEKWYEKRKSENDKNVLKNK